MDEIKETVRVVLRSQGVTGVAQLIAALTEGMAPAQVSAICAAAKRKAEEELRDGGLQLERYYRALRGED